MEQFILLLVCFALLYDLQMVGTAGYEANPEWEKKPAWSVFRETSHGLLRVTVMEPTVLYAEFIRSDGSIADRFMIDKHIPETK
jgi:hypothetical protein